MTDENEEYFVSLKALIEETYSINDNHPVILVCHSMGCLFSLYFLKHQDQKWKDKHVRSMISIGAPFGGATRALTAVTSGETMRLV